jgi:hypothetical protein
MVPCQGRSFVASLRDGLRPPLTRQHRPHVRPGSGKSRKGWPRALLIGLCRVLRARPLALLIGVIARFRFQSVGWIAGLGRPSYVGLRRLGWRVGLGGPFPLRSGVDSAAGLSRPSCPPALGRRPRSVGGLGSPVALGGGLCWWGALPPCSRVGRQLASTTLPSSAGVASRPWWGSTRTV